MPQWTQWIVPVSISAATTLVGLAALIHTLSKERGVHAQRTRLIELASARMDFWKTRLEVLKESLPEDDLTKEKAEIVARLNAILTETNANLTVLKLKNVPLAPIGVPIWRRQLFLYMPLTPNKIAGFVNRATFWLALLITIYMGQFLCADMDGLGRHEKLRMAKEAQCFIVPLYVTSARYWLACLKQER